MCKWPRENPELIGNKNMKTFEKQELHRTKLINEINAWIMTSKSENFRQVLFLVPAEKSKI